MVFVCLSLSLSLPLSLTASVSLLTDLHCGLDLIKSNLNQHTHARTHAHTRTHRKQANSQIQYLEERTTFDQTLDFQKIWTFKEERIETPIASPTPTPAPTPTLPQPLTLTSASLGFWSPSSKFLLFRQLPKTESILPLFYDFVAEYAWDLAKSEKASGSEYMGLLDLDRLKRLFLNGFTQPRH